MKVNIVNDLADLANVKAASLFDLLFSEIMAGLLKLRLHSLEHPGGERNLPRNENGVDVVSRASKAAAGMRRYWAKLKQNPELYVLHRLEEQQSSRKYRKNLSDEKKDMQKAQACERMRRYRECQKETLQGGEETQGVMSRKPQTRSELEKLATRRHEQRKKCCDVVSDAFLKVVSAFHDGRTRSQ